MRYERRRFILDAISAAIQRAEVEHKQECLVCGDDRDFNPATIKVTNGENTFDFNAEVTSVATPKDGWVELVDRGLEFDEQDRAKALAICKTCAIRKGMAKPEPDPEAIPVAPGTTPGDQPIKTDEIPL